MCAIAGLFNINRSLPAPVLHHIIIKMTDALIHRGPDDSGVWCDSSHGIALGHRRLSILDLSAAGHQPMHSHKNRYVIVYNGEIYNHLEIRSRLQHDSILPIKWNSHSDTETLLAAIERWGLHKALQMTTGMFAFALWDRQTKTLILARDRIGEKPLYYGWINDSFIFASELKAIKQHPNFDAVIDTEALVLYFRHNYIPTPYCIYKGFKKLIPGTYLTINTDKESVTSYWTAIDVVNNALQNQFAGSEYEAIEVLEGMLKKSVKEQMISDVPLGAFLSGGIDSSTIVSLMQALSNHKVKTFSIGFYDLHYNEAVHAKAVAHCLGTEHTEMYVTYKDALDVIPLLPQIYDEPFADSSQIPTYLLSKLTKQHVTVSLSGDGGDEIFGGYNRYFWGNSILKTFSNLSIPLRNMLTKALTLFSPDRWDSIFKIAYKLLPQRYRYNMPGDRLHKLAEIISAKDLTDMYIRLVSINKEPCKLFDGAIKPTDTSMQKKIYKFDSPVQAMMFQDIVTYLRDDILVKVDRAAMACSLETRIPFLNHHVIEFAWRLPLEMKIKSNISKWILRQILYKYLPQKLIERPKMGFGIPIDKWLRLELKDWAIELLSEKTLKEEGLNYMVINKYLHEHLSGKLNRQYWLWGVLMYMAWRRR